MKKLLFFVIILFSLFALNKIKATSPCPDYLSWTPVTDDNVATHTDDYAENIIWGTCSYYYNYSGNHYDVVITSSENHSSKWKLTDKSFKNIMLYYIANYLAGYDFGRNVYWPGTVTISFYYESNCHSNVGCAIRLADDYANEICCAQSSDLANVGNCIFTDSQTGHPYIKLGVENLVCGTKCCEKTYTVQYQDPTYNGIATYTYINIINISTQTSNSGNCTSTYQNCKDNSYYPCNDEDCDFE
jgi:hypothetical protein